VIGPGGTIQASYDKVHLVPLGEYLPLQAWLEAVGIQQLTRLPGGFAAGESRRDLELGDGLRLRPLICYEAIFPTESAGEDRPDALLNVTNDGWFGDSAGPHQHFAQARVRAVEQGLPLIRAANTGISAVVDPLGRVIDSLPVGTMGTIDAALPRASAPTLYSRFGILLVIALYFATIVGVFTPPLRV
jgi:apolipoprotein N-acyltransferase